MIYSLTAAAGNAEQVYEKFDIWNLSAWLCDVNGWTGQTTLIVSLIAAFLCMIIPYLLGSINPAVLISKIFYHEDIRDFGSGNAGTTNMLRTYGKKAAAATFLCDLLKAALAVLLGRLLWGFDGGAIAGFFVIFGHMFPLFAHFRGGKGVACLAMVVLMENWLTFLILLLAYVVIVAGTRYISLASVMCAFLYPLILRAFANRGLNVAMAILCTAFVVFMHRENLKRLWAGKESKVSFSKLSKKKKGEETAVEAATASEESDGGEDA